MPFGQLSYCPLPLFVPLPCRFFNRQGIVGLKEPLTVFFNLPCVFLRNFSRDILTFNAHTFLHLSHMVHYLFPISHTFSWCSDNNHPLRRPHLERIRPFSFSSFISTVSEALSTHGTWKGSPNWPMTTKSDWFTEPETAQPIVSLFAATFHRHNKSTRTLWKSSPELILDQILFLTDRIQWRFCWLLLLAYKNVCFLPTS